MRSLFQRVAVAGVLTLGVAGTAAAQSPARPNLLSINPLGIPFEYFSMEYERFATGLTSLGLQGSYISIDDGTYATLEAKLRFYPNEEGPRGLALGLAGGITRLTEDNQYDPVTNGTRRAEETRPTIAVIVDYNWVLGRARRVVVGAGVGAKRILGTQGDYFVPTAYPTGRFQIGVRF